MMEFSRKYLRSTTTKLGSMISKSIFLYSSLGKEVLSITVNTILIITSVLVIFLFIKKRRKLMPIVLPLIIAIVFIKMIERPEERIHFLEYGILGFLVFKAIGKEIKQIILALIFIILIGSIDEFIQYLLPNRVGDVRDIIMNSIGGIIGLWLGRFW